MARRDRRRVLCPTCNQVVAIMATTVDASGVRQCRRHQDAGIGMRAGTQGDQSCYGVVLRTRLSSLSYVPRLGRIGCPAIPALAPYAREAIADPCESRRTYFR